MREQGGWVGHDPVPDVYVIFNMMLFLLLNRIFLFFFFDRP